MFQIGKENTSEWMIHFINIEFFFLKNVLKWRKTINNIYIDQSGKMNHLKAQERYRLTDIQTELGDL